MTINDLYYECAAEIKQAITFLGFTVERPVR